MTPFDYAVLLIVGGSVLLSFLRGAVREVLALSSWVVAFFVANAYSVWLAGQMPASIPNEQLRLLAAFLALFLVVLLLMTLFSIALSELVKKIGLGSLDRSLGVLFGLTRGVLIVMVLVLLSGLTTLPGHAFWREAMFSAPFEAFAVGVKPWLPDEFSRRLNYD